MLFQKIFEGVKFNFDIDDIEQKFTGDILEETYNPICEKTDGSPHWQYYSTRGAAGIRVSRNLQLNFPTQTKTIIDTVCNIQTTIRNSSTRSPLIEKFLNQKIRYKNFKQFNLLKISAGLSVKPHIDPRRTMALNIGLKNSNACKTIFSQLTERDGVDLFSNAVKSTFVMEDGDVYLLAVNHMHAVESLDASRDRYIITYTFDQ